MQFETIEKMGKKAFVQSLKPYKGQILKDVAVFGLDTEFVPRVDKPSDLICWQLAWDSGCLLTTRTLDIASLFREANNHTEKWCGTFVFVTFFAMAELQFFDMTEWTVSEFKGKYGMSMDYAGHKLLVVDLANWYPKQKLASVAEQWGLKKLEYPIGDRVEAIERGEATKADLLADREFIEYAKHDAVITQRIYSEMRSYFIDRWGVDIVRTMTAAGTSAAMFRKGLGHVIDQPDAALRKLSLESCWGGRMECVFRGHKPTVFEYDASGHHPASTIALGVLPEAGNWRRVTGVREWLSGNSGVGRVYFKFPPDEQYPCLPVFYDGALLFPLEGVSFCSVSEARLARELGASLILYDGFSYHAGTPVLADYLLTLQGQRNASSTESEKQLLKLLSNSMIGKLFQKTIGVDLKLVQNYAMENNLPFEIAIRVKGVDFGADRVTVGSCFYPEWYALILGYARASISRQAREHRALVVSSDSFVTEEQMPNEFVREGITYKVKSSGEYVGYRTRFYRVGDKLAHHAVHSRASGEEVLASFRDGGVHKYDYYRFTHLKEAWRDKKPFGSRVLKHMSVGLGYDYKRKLLPDGWSVPWNTLAERDAFIAALDTTPDTESPYAGVIE